MILHYIEESMQETLNIVRALINYFNLEVASDFQIIHFKIRDSIFGLPSINIKHLILRGDQIII